MLNIKLALGLSQQPRHILQTCNLLWGYKIYKLCNMDHIHVYGPFYTEDCVIWTSFDI